MLLLLLIVSASAQVSPTPIPTVGDFHPVDVSSISEYPGNYYITGTHQRITDDTVPNFYLGYLFCPGPSVCVPSWIGNGHCDDCFGCDQYMVATGFYGDCSRCDYFWSGGAEGVGEFDGGDCGDHVFPSSINNKVLDECLVNANFRTDQELVGVGYVQKRNTIISELEIGGWGTTAELQADTDVQLASKCEYANIKECLRTNDWYVPSTMDSMTEGVLKFEASTQIQTFSTYTSIELVYMTNVNLLEECVLAGIHQKIDEFQWQTSTELDAMDGEAKRNYVIQKLSDLGKGTVAQLQTLTNAQLRYLLNHTDGTSRR